MTIVAVTQLLRQLRLDQYVEAFEREQIDWDALRTLSDADLRELGLPMGPRNKLEAAIAHTREAEVAANQPASASPVAPATEPDSERRQLTVLFCDMVGFTELASRVDPEVLERIVHAYEDACAVCITRFEGYVFQRLGDGIVAFFGYPLAHEGEAQRAIRAGLAIIESLARLELPEVGRVAVRIGIATGLVVVASTEKGAVGETMNLASRLQGIARPGSIVVSDRVRRLAAGAFEYEDLGQYSLKGIAQLTQAWRVTGLSEAATRFEAARGEALVPLVGREQELALLLDRWALSQEGEGQVVLLSGEPGIGKSRLLNALHERLRVQDAQALRFQCSPYYVNSALWPSVDHFERALGFARDDSPESRLDKLEAFVVGRCARPLADVRFLASMLSVPCESRYGSLNTTPQKFKDETRRTLVDVTEAIARTQPTVMLFEDIHWADPTTLEALDLLIDRAHDVPLLILLTYRPEFQSRWNAHGHVAALNLSKLTRTQSNAMVSRLAGKPLPADLAEQILAKTDGVPLFVEELTKSILESGELKDAGDRYEYAGNRRSIAIPATLRDSLMARLDRYQPVKEIAQIGGAIGREFSYELITAVAPMTTEQIDAALAQLTDSGLAFRRGTPPEATYVFKHALIQDAAYDSLLKSRRQELHAKIARLIEQRLPATKTTEPEVLAHHYTQSGDLGQAIPLWQRAGELALNRMALSESIAHLNCGLDLVATQAPSSKRDQAELALRVPLGTAWLALKGWAAEEVWDSNFPALGLAISLRNNNVLIPIYWGLFAHMFCRGRVRDSLEWVERALKSARETGDAALLLVGHMAAVTAYYWMGESADALEHALAVENLYRRDLHGHIVMLTNHDPKTQVGACGANLKWILGYPDQAVALSAATIDHVRHLGHPFALGWLLTVGSGFYEYRGEPEELLKRTQETERLGHDTRLLFVWACLAPMYEGIALVRAGKPTEALEPLNRGLAFWEGSGGRTNCTYLRGVLAEGLAQTGAVDEALSMIEKQIEQADRPGWEERFFHAELLRLKGWVYCLKRQPERSEKCFLQSLEAARRQHARSWELRTATSLARLWQSQGRTREAAELLAPIYAWFTEGFDTKDLREAKALLEELGA